MKALKLILGVVAVPAIFVTLIVLVNVYHVYVDPDPLEEVQRDTRHMLRDYERTQDPSELRGMFSYPPQEGGAMTAMPIVADWAMKHQGDFISIIDGLHEGDDRRVFVGSFTGVISQSDLDRKFAEAFRDYESPVLNQIKEYLPPARMWRPTKRSNEIPSQRKEHH